MKFREIPINYVAEVCDGWGNKTKITLDKSSVNFKNCEGDEIELTPDQVIELADFILSERLTDDTRHTIGTVC
jgi:hypothetical protein